MTRQAVFRPTQGSVNKPPALFEPASYRRRSVLVGLIVVLVTVVVMAALSTFLWRQRQAPATYTGPTEKLRIGNVGEYSIFNIVAKREGYFKKNGLDATITEYSSGPPGVADLLAGKEDVAIAADFVGVTNIFTHQNLRILAQVSQQQSFQVIARKDKGIARPSDLKGKKIGLTRKGAGEFFLGRFAELNNINLADLTLADLAPADMVAQLTSGQLDAVVIFEPHGYNLKKNLGDQFVSWSAQGDQTTLTSLYSTDEFIKAHPDTIKRYLASLVEAEGFVAAHPQAAQAQLAQAMKYDPAYVQYLWPKIHFDLRLDQQLLLNMEDEARFAIDNRLAGQTAVPNYLDYIYFTGLKSVKPEAVTIVH